MHSSNETAVLSSTHPVEGTVAKIWAEILNIGQVDLYDNFFTLGGDSLSATRITSRIQAQFNIEMPVTTLFGAPHLADFASLVRKRLMENEKKDPGTFGSQEILSRRTHSPAPLSFGQQRLWFLHLLHEGNPAYNCYVAFRLKGTLDSTALEKSLNEIIIRHEIFRTTFHVLDEQPYQEIVPDLILRIKPEDLRKIAEPHKKATIDRSVREEIQRPFDLSQGPLIRVKLLQVEDQEHIFLLTIHHTVIDVWSRDILYRELSTLYEAVSQGNTARLPQLPVQYSDFALWQRQRINDGKADPQLSYWKEQLGGSLSVMELPTDNPRPAVQTFQGAKHFLSIPTDLYKALKLLSKSEGCTLFMVLLAAFKTMLYRYTGQEDMIVGSFIAGRNRPEVEGLIGFFLNTLPFRTDLSGDPSFMELLARVRKTALEAYAHQDIPFEKLIDELEPERDLSRNPLFQVAFTLSPAEVLELNGLSISTIDIDSGTAQFDMALNLKEGNESLRGYFEYNTDLFYSSTVERMSEHFRVLLKSIVEDPNQCISDLPLLPPSERHRLLVEWNRTDKGYPEKVCLQDLFEAQVERTPERVAVVYEDRQLTYRELNKRANQLASFLQVLGVGPDVLVGVFMERSLEMVIALYGILKAGGAYVPLDPEYPADRLSFMVEDTQVPVLLTQARLSADIPQNGAEVVCLDTDWKVISKESDENPLREVREDHLAYVIYTSGSTGKPKGVMNRHRGICNRLLWMQDEYRLTETDHVLQKTPFSFDVSVWEFFWPLIVGARLIVARPGGHKDSAYLADLITEQGITTLHFVPSMLQIFLEEKGIERCRSLRRVICSGEALPYELQERFFSRMEAELHNLYGPTEAAVDVTYWPCRRENTRRIVPIGFPVANTRMYVLDRRMQPVPVGVPGELHIGGVQVARGYLNRPELTAEKFIRDPFCSDPEARLYKTGDLACYLPDGAIRYLGRIDHQVKIQGNRIELGEIESVLEMHPEIKQAVVLALEDGPAAKRLVAYLVNTDGYLAGTSELRAYLQEKLPDYMIPSAFVVLDSMPLSPNGKVDRRALPKPDTKRPELAQNYVPPRTPLERHLADMWCEIIKVDGVGIHDRFFELGGTSIKAARFINRLQQELGEKIYITSLFQAPTVAGYAAFLQKAYPHPLTKLGLISASDEDMTWELAVSPGCEMPGSGNKPSVILRETARKTRAHSRRELLDQRRQHRQRNRSEVLKDNIHDE